MSVGSVMADSFLDDQKASMQTTNMRTGIQFFTALEDSHTAELTLVEGQQVPVIVKSLRLISQFHALCESWTSTRNLPPQA